MNLQLSDKIMLLQPINIVYHKNASITIVLGAMVMLLLFSSCSGKKKELGDAITERDSMAVMDTRGVTTLVSDSGVTRYRINTEEWLVFDRKNPPYWAFEKGVYLEKFDSIFQVEASIKADTAYFFNKEGAPCVQGLFAWDGGTLSVTAYAVPHTSFCRCATFSPGAGCLLYTSSTMNSSPLMRMATEFATSAPDRMCPIS